jgi:hypothetical protein
VRFAVWWLAWCGVGILAGLVIMVPVSWWVWEPPELLSLWLGGGFAAAGAAFGAWLKGRR